MNARGIRMQVVPLALLIAAALTITTGARADVQGVVRKVYVTVLDKSDNPVVDMKASEFELKEGGKVQEISSKIADAPLRLAVLVADRGSGAFQLATLRLLEPLVGKGEFSIVSIIAQPELAVDFTSDARAISSGLDKVSRRGMATQSAQLVETIQDIARKIKKDGTRPVIVVMRAANQAPTPIRAEVVRDDIRKSGAMLYTVSTIGTQGMQRPTQVGGSSASTAAQAMSNDEQNEGMLTLGTVLGEGAKDSGGRHDQNVGNTLVPTVGRIAKELLSQYEISYTLPAGTKPSDRVQVTSKRKDVKVQAPTRMAN